MAPIHEPTYAAVSRGTSPVDPGGDAFAPAAGDVRAGRRRRLLVGGMAALIVAVSVAGWMWRSSGDPGKVSLPPRTAEAPNVAEGIDAFIRGRQYDAFDRVEQAISSYERAFSNLPQDDPRREIAKTRLDALRLERSKLATVLGLR